MPINWTEFLVLYMKDVTVENSISTSIIVVNGNKNRNKNKSIPFTEIGMRSRNYFKNKNCIEIGNVIREEN